MSKIEANTIDSISGTSTLTLGSSNASTIALGSGDVQSNFLYPAFMARMSADQSISSNTATKVDFDTEVFDTDGAYDHSTNQRFTVPTGKAGKYYITCTLGTDDGNEGSTFVVDIRKNGSNSGESSYNRIQRTSGVLSFDAHTIIDLSAGDYIEIYARHETAVNLQPGINSGEFRSRFGGYRIGT